MGQNLSERLGVLKKITEIKRIYASLENSFNGNKCVCIAVTSGVPGEGKTTIAAGIAVAAAENGSRVLAVDYNWYSPSLHDYFSVDLKMNHGEFIGEESIENIVQKTGVENLDVIPAVKTVCTNGVKNNGSEIAVLNMAKEHYDVIIVDTSAAFPTNYRMIDPVALSRDIDGVILVALANVTPKQDVKRTSVAIETAGGNILGIVANQWQNPIYN